MEWTANIRIKGCDESLGNLGEKGLLGTCTIEIPDDRCERMPLVMITESLQESAREFLDTMISIEIVPKEDEDV